MASRVFGVEFGPLLYEAVEEIDDKLEYEGFFINEKKIIPVPEEKSDGEDVTYTKKKKRKYSPDGLKKLDKQNKKDLLEKIYTLNKFMEDEYKNSKYIAN